MELVIDQDVKAVAEFMQGNLPAAKLVSVVNALASIAPALWGRYPIEEVAALQLSCTPISGRDRHTQSAAIG